MADVRSSGREAARVFRAAGERGTLAFMGLGEPLLHPRFLDMTQLAKQQRLRFELTTNALLLEPDLARGLLATGLDQIVVSIYGASAEAFGRVRSGASLHTVVENVSRLHDHRGPNDSSSVTIGIEFVAMRSNVDELPGLNRVAAQLGASFIIVSNVLPYASALIGESLYEWSATSSEAVLSTARPSWRLPKFDWDEKVGAAVGKALFRSGPVSFLDAATDGASSRCPFIHADACAVAWYGGVSPCPPLLHTYSCFLHGREKQMVRWEAGRSPDESLIGVWRRPEYLAFRDRVRAFDFSPCTACGDCDMAETNAEDCFGSPHPACGDCHWARRVIRCA